MNTAEIRSLNPDITSDRISMPYPHIELLKPSDAAALMLTCLPKGDVPVICSYQGKQRRIASIMRSAKVFDNLRKVSPLVYHITSEQNKTLNTILDIMEVLL